MRMNADSTDSPSSEGRRTRATIHRVSRPSLVPADRVTTAPARRIRLDATRSPYAPQGAADARGALAPLRALVVFPAA